MREQLSLCAAESALRRNRPPDHVLMSGGPGLGKTTLSMIIATELSVPLRITSGPALERAGGPRGDPVDPLRGRGPVHRRDPRMSRPAEEMLYLAMEDFRVDIVVGKGPGATAIPLEIAPFTLVGATTRAGMLPAPLRDRFGFVAHMDFYGVAELEEVLHRSSRLLGVTLPDDAAREIAGPLPGHPPASPTGCCAGSATSPRCAPRASSPGMSPPAALNLYEVDAEGLDRLDRARCSGRCCASSVAGRWGCRPSRSRWGRSRRRSRWSPSRSWCGRGCWPAPPVAGSRPRRPGRIWGWCPRRTPSGPRSSSILRMILGKSNVGSR
ncbi:AAA family ATPase [Streptosporangium vulgare]|uniref:AAA family ATPase n=1 Tax=Streptosporangium vulgare TaxID=46190 RepID=UPI003CD0ACFE